MGTFNHTMQISAISLSQCGLSTERILAFLDFNKDLHILTIREQKLKSHKIGKI